MCFMCGDSFSLELPLAPLLNHQCCYVTSDKHPTITLETYLDESKRKVEVILASYHNASNIVQEELYHGYILVYSAKRQASLATLRSVLPHSVLLFCCADHVSLPPTVLSWTNCPLCPLSYWLWRRLEQPMLSSPVTTRSPSSWKATRLQMNAWLLASWWLASTSSSKVSIPPNDFLKTLKEWPLFYNLCGFSCFLYSVFPWVLGTQGRHAVFFPLLFRQSGGTFHASH